MDQSAHIPELVTATLSELGLCPAPATLIRTFALMEGRRVAHKFRYDTGYAVWTVDRGVVDFYDADGNPLRTVALKPAKGERAA
ncbi:MAG: hypothetical protein ABSF26_11095 [Thermoguttaceae bacterium]